MNTRLAYPARPALRATGVLLTLLLAATSVLVAQDGGAFLGITSRNVTGEEARYRNLPSRDGVVLQTVLDGTAAAAAGLQDGDIVLQFGGEKIYDDRDLTDMIRRRSPGDSVSITFLRDSEKRTVEAILGSREDYESSRRSDDGRDGWSRFWDEVGEIFGGPSSSRGPRLGVHIQEMGDQLAEYFAVRENEGVLLTHISRGSPAEEAGLRAGDVVLEVDGRKIRGSGDISRSLRDKWGETVPVAVMRSGKRMEIPVTLEEE
jgi:serine protease Do